MRNARSPDGKRKNRASSRALHPRSGPEAAPGREIISPRLARARNPSETTKTTRSTGALRARCIMLQKSTDNDLSPFFLPARRGSFYFAPRDAGCVSHVNYVARRVSLKMHALVRLN